MSVKTEMQAWWYTILSQLIGSNYYRLRARGLTPQRASARMLRDMISPRLRWKVMQRDNFTCTKCGRTPPYVRLEVDHIIPLAKGGTNNGKNLQTLCYWCNRGKGAT